MADGIRIEFDEAKLQEIISSPTGPAAISLAKYAQRVTNRAKQLAPVDTGRLRSSISWELGIEGGSLTANVGTDVEYALFVEFGTRFWMGHPFLLPAFFEVVHGG